MLTLFFVFTFLIKFIWPNKKFFIVLQRRYGHETTISFRNLEKIDLKINKTRLDIEYLEKCLKFNVIPKFLFFKLANHRLRNSKVYHEIQLKLLRDEIKNHKKVLHELLPKHELSLSQLWEQVKLYDFLVINSKLKQLTSIECNTIDKIHC